ncbi:hypothetical protein C477_04544 [Haloterrigena salina JCM 13891]|uniref:Uncharacterized protein n=1 Tax=Haloterrigena salina JCM 13891 TaxID=1227488 RepID=M0CGX0_9EURY|nr:hypothetical protein C477_04544 [Haloterrigena salina JCM 13891]
MRIRDEREAKFYYCWPKVTVNVYGTADGYGAYTIVDPIGVVALASHSSRSVDATSCPVPRRMRPLAAVDEMPSCSASSSSEISRGSSK